MQLGGDLQRTWLMFNHCIHVLGWSTTAWHVYDPNYARVMTIAICDMQSEDVESQVLMWRTLMKFMKANGIHMPQFKGFIVDNAQVN
jgi:hypothetical protein